MIVVVVLAIVFILCWLKWGRSSSLPLPPHYPFSLPVFGNLLSLGSLPHLQISEYMYKYKYPLMSVKFGSMPVVFIKDASLMHEAFVTKSQNFYHRPLPTSMAVFTRHDEGGSDLAFATNPDIWKRYRRVVAAAFTRTKIRTQQQHLEEELVEFDCQVSLLAKSHSPVDFSFFSKRYTLNVVQRFVFGTWFSYSDTQANETSAKIVKQVEEVMTRLGPNEYISDYVPILSVLDSAKKKMFKQALDDMRDLVNPQIDLHREQLDPDNPKDLLDVILIEARQHSESGMFSKLDIMLLCIDMYLGGMDTSSNVIDWFIYFLAKYPEYQEKVFQEISQVADASHYLKYADEHKTPLLKATIQEVSRVRPVLPFSVLRKNAQDDTIGGYFIPKDTSILWNVYGYNNDPEVWENPSSFYPERFLSSKNELHNFGGGSRMCAGKSLGEEEVYNACAMLVQRYTWELDAPHSDIWDQGVASLVLRPHKYKVLFSAR